MGKHFVLTISREFGAEGHEIGKVLSERLGVKLYVCKGILYHHRQVIRLCTSR